MSETWERTAAEVLATPVQFLKGVGPPRAELFAKLGVFAARDLVFFFPRDYQDLTDVRSVPELEEGVPLSVRGVVEEIDQRSSQPGRSILGVLVRQDRWYLRAIWFNQPFMRDKFERGQHVLLFGKPKYAGGRWEMSHPRVEWLETEYESPAAQLQPVYPLTEGLKQHQVRQAVEQALASCLDLLEEVFPQQLLVEYRLLPLRDALPKIHFPQTRDELEQARRRLIFQELYILQLALAIRRHQLHDLRHAPPMPATAKIDARIRRLLPFELTPDQNQSLREITADLAQDRPMNRLLQGEVGSGKTIVAVYAMMLTVAHGYQAAMMAPTEVLARQHAETLGRVLERSQVRIGLLTGGLGRSERTQLLERIAAGEIDVVIGTQAIVHSVQQFAKLGLVIIDEQHKFGVRQRAALKQAGVAPHYLVMTATPIPRSISMTLFGDLDVSTIRHSPPGRQPVHTYLIEPARQPQWWEFVRKKIGEGHQVYVVAPLVVDSEDENLEDVQSAERAYEQLTNGELADFRVDLLHGRMGPEEKDHALRTFRRRETQVLVSTSVIEVGVDVPNATLMTIQGAERFGLAQLHQLRGRISRGTHAGYCGVFVEPQSEDANVRLNAFARTTDGFELSEIDFRLRGPGDLLGTRQHGLPPLRIADLHRDAELLEEARRAAQQLVPTDPGLAAPAHALLRRMVLTRYGEALDLGDVG